MFLSSARNSFNSLLCHLSIILVRHQSNKKQYDGETPHVSCVYLKANLPAVNKTDAYVMLVYQSESCHIYWPTPSTKVEKLNLSSSQFSTMVCKEGWDVIGLDWTTKLCWVSLHFGGGYISTCVSSLKAKVLVDILWLLAKDWKKKTKTKTKFQVLEGPFNYTHKKLSISLTNGKFS